MSDENQTCQGCGAKIDSGETTCPYCGHAQLSKSSTQISKASTGRRAVREGEKTYRVDRERGTIHFGDGERGRRPESGTSSIREAYRRGGRSGNVQVCMKCRHVQKKIRDTCENCGAKLKK